MAKNNDTERYSAMIAEGRSHQKQHSKNWRRWLGYLDNKSVLGDVSTGSKEYRFFINLAFMNWANLRPALYFKNPQFKARPRPASRLNTEMPYGGELAARLMEHALDHFNHENNLKREAKLCIIESLAVGVSVFKSGYHIPTKNIEKKRKQLQKIAGLNKAMGNDDPDIAKELKKLEDADIAALSMHDIPDDESLWGHWTSIQNILVPFGYGNWISGCPWVAERIEKRRGDAHSEYPEVAKLGLEPTAVSPYSEDGKPDCYEVYEIWDWLERKRVYVVPNHKNKQEQIVVKTLGWPKGLEKYPYEELKFSESLGTFYAMPDTAFYESMMEAVSDTVSMAVGHLRRFKTMYKNDQQLSEEQKAKLERPMDGDVLDDPAFKNLVPLDRPPVPPESQPVVDRLLYFADQIAGMTQTRRGSGKKLTATQVMEESAGLDARYDERRDILEDWLSAIGKTQMQLVQKNMSRGLTVDLAPEEAKAFGFQNPWARVSQKDIDAELDLWVIAGSTAKDDPVQTAQKYEVWFNLSMQLPFVDQRMMWQTYSQKSLGLPREVIEKHILPERDPDAEKLSQYENMMILQGQPVEPPGPDESHAIHVEAHQQALNSLATLPQEMQRLQMDAQAYMNSGQPMPPGLNAALQDIGRRMQLAGQAQQQLTAMIEGHQRFMQGGGPINYNLLNAKPSGGTVIDGGSTPAERAGSMPAAQG